MATRIILCSEQFVIVVTYIIRYLYHNLRYGVAILLCNLHIRDEDYVQNDVIVNLIDIMVMAIPVTCLGMYLYIACPNMSVKAHFSIKKIRTLISIVLTRVYDFYTLSCCRDQITQSQPMFPYIMQELLHVRNYFTYFFPPRM